MKSDLDVWAIQGNKDETKIALQNVKKDSKGNILYLNCQCNFRIGDRKIKNRTFDSLFYSEESDMIILFSRGKITESEIEKYLIDGEIDYTVIRFIEPENQDYVDEEEFPQIYFVRDKFSLEKVLDDSIAKGEKKCVYLPELLSAIHLNYKAEDKERYEIEGRLCKGLLVFNEKIILFVNQIDPKNLKEKDIRQILEEKGIACKQNKKR